jgi:hypothetical protein
MPDVHLEGMEDDDESNGREGMCRKEDSDVDDDDDGHDMSEEEILVWCSRYENVGAMESYML